MSANEIAVLEIVVRRNWNLAQGRREMLEFIYGLLAGWILAFLRTIFFGDYPANPMGGGY